MESSASFRDCNDDALHEKKCRACLQQHSNHHLYSLDSKNLTILDDGSEQTIAEIYHQCTQLLYEPSDGHPQWICQCCTEKMIEFFQFRKMCHDSYNTLKLASEIVSAKTSSLKVEISGEYYDAATYATESGSSVVTKQETIFEMNSNGTNLNASDDETAICVGWDVPLPEANEQSEKDEEENDDDNDDDDVDFKYDDESSEDSDDSNDAQEIKKRPPPTRRKSSRQAAKRVVKTKKTTSVGDVPKSSEPIYACDKCPRKFFKEYRYGAHMRRHQGLKAYKCDQCDKEFQKFGTLKAHTAAKHYDESKGPPPVYSCDVDGCDRTYSIKESLRIHMQNVHLGKKPAITERMCEHCGKAFKSNAALVKHTYTHTKVTPFKCDTCSKMFPSAYKLKEHVMRHKGIKNFVCPTCGLRKTTGHELRVHMRYHTGDLQFPCELCSQVFRRDSNRKRHMKVVHCGVKAYKCPYCDQSFGKAETRKHHVARHTGEKPHACQICDKRFIQQVALKAHMKTHNKKIIENPC